MPGLLPTRASLLTGLYPDRQACPESSYVPLPEQTTSWGNLRDDVVMLPSLLKAAGYQTGIVGKWHLGLEKPTALTTAFDHFHGWLGDMMDDYLTHRRHGINYLRLDEQEIDPQGHATDLFTDWAIDFIRSSRSGDPEHPWFLYLAYNAPHTPIQPPLEWLERVKAREPGMSEQRAALVALIEHLDDGIGRVLSHLKSSGEADHTFILFTSDNGGKSRWEPKCSYRGGKQEMWQGGLRGHLRLLAGHIAPGTEARGAVSLSMDIFPTVAAVAGVSAPDGIDGRSFRPNYWESLFSS
ncbi:MAG: sulfatase-like hydrolase/transferase [Verrucomicrobiales bacterium]